MPLVYSCEGMPTIQRFFESDAYIRGLMGPYGSGKSSACVMEIAQRGIRQAPGPDGVRRSRFAVIRNTIKQLEDTTERTFLQWFPPIQYGDWTPSKHNYKIRALRADGDDRGAEIEVLFRALDRPDQKGDLLSMELTGAWINEGREIDWEIFEAVTGRTGRYPPKGIGPGATWFGLFSDTNPPDTDSDWYRFFEEEDHTEKVAELAKVVPGITVDGFRQIFKQPSGRSARAENLNHLVDGYYQREAIGKSDEWVKIFVDGQYGFTVEGRPVWPGYSDSLHCPAEKRLWPRPIEGLPIQRGWDFGGTPACAFSQLTPRGQWIVFDEKTSTRSDADEFSDNVLDHCAREYPRFDFEDIGDPAGNSRSDADSKTCFMILRGKNILIEPGIQTLAIRLASVAKPLRTLVDGGFPQFVLHPRCKDLRRGMMGGYHFRRMKISGERYAETPEKNKYSHICDALGYTATRLFGVALRMPPDDGRGRRDYGDHLDDRSRSQITGY